MTQDEFSCLYEENSFTCIIKKGLAMLDGDRIRIEPSRMSFRLRCLIYREEATRASFQFPSLGKRRVMRRKI